MRSYLIFLIMLFNLMAIPARGEDVVLGRVASVDRESGEVVLHLAESKDEQKTDTDDMPKEVIVKFDPDRLPGYISVGETVLVWGEYSADRGRGFQVQNIGKGYFRTKSDPTGVRRRLGRSRGRMRRPRQPPRHPPRRHR